MASWVNVPEPHFEYWNRVAETSDIERIPDEFPFLGGFEYFVAPDGAIQHERATGGYDTFHDDGRVESMIIVGSEIPKEVRGLWVAHLVMHKTEPDDGTPHLCAVHDRSIQHFLSDVEPSLIGFYYADSVLNYLVGKQWVERSGIVRGVELERYKRAIRHAADKGKSSKQADEVRDRLQQIGLVLPDDENALMAVNRATGERTVFTLQTERGNRHKCRSCSHPIIKGTERITTSIERPRDGRDHHHYHPACVSHVELGLFGAFSQTEPHHPY